MNSTFDGLMSAMGWNRVYTEDRPCKECGKPLPEDSGPTRLYHVECKKIVNKRTEREKSAKRDNFCTWCGKAIRKRQLTCSPECTTLYREDSEEGRRRGNAVLNKLKAQHDREDRLEVLKGIVVFNNDAGCNIEIKKEARESSMRF